MAKYVDQNGLDRFYDNIADRPVQAFDTVADMQAATYLEAGMTCHTNGFHAAGDGGAAHYTISTGGTANGMDVLALQGGLVATLVVTDSYVTPEQFGAWGDGTHDDYAAIAKALDVCDCISLYPLKTYFVSSSVMIAYKQNVYGNNAKMVGDSTSAYPIIVVDGSTSAAYRTFVSINDVHIDGSSAHEGVLFDKAADFTINNVVVENATTAFHFKNSLVFTFNNCHVQGCDTALYNDDVSISPCNNVLFNKCSFVSNKYVLNSTAFAFKNAMFVNCDIEANSSDSDAVIVIPAAQTGTGGNALTFESCWFESNTPRDIYSRTERHTPIVVNNCFITHGSNEAICFAEGTSSEFAIILNGCQDYSTYINSGNTVVGTSIYIMALNCHSRVSSAAPENIVGMENSFNRMNTATIHDLYFNQQGSFNKGRITAGSNYLRLYANDTLGVQLADCSWEKPLRLGNTIYMWPYGNALYVKTGTARPTAYNDGTQIV